MDLVKWLLLFLYIFVIASAVRRRVQKLDEPINDEVLIARSFEEWSRLPRETLSSHPGASSNLAQKRVWFLPLKKTTNFMQKQLFLRK